MRRILLLAMLPLGTACIGDARDPVSEHSYGVQQSISPEAVAEFGIDADDCADFAGQGFSAEQIEVLPVGEDYAAILLQGEIVCITSREGAARNFQVAWLEGDETDDPEPEPYDRAADPEPEPYDG